MARTEEAAPLDSLTNLPMTNMTIPTNENQYIEFKSEQVHANDLAEEVIAFANSEGGEIWLGIEDDGSISGLSRAYEEDIMNICRTSCIPPIVPLYTEHVVGSTIRIFVFDDRLEFISPGRLPNTVTVAKLPIGTSFARNPVLVRLMENLGYIDKLGRGLPMVWQEARKLGEQVEFIESGEEFRVILPLPAYM